MKLECAGQFIKKYSNIKYHENPRSGSRVVPCGRSDGRTEGWTDMTKLVVAFRNFANTPKNLAQKALVLESESLNTRLHVSTLLI